MSTAQSLVEAALRQDSSMASYPRSRGLKRKTSMDQADLAEHQPPRRSARRQAAGAASTTRSLVMPPTANVGSHQRAPAPSMEQYSEPSRGEEENLISYDWATRDGVTKRTRTSPSPIHQQSHPDATYGNGAWGSPSNNVSSSDGGSLPLGIENLAAAAEVYQSTEAAPSQPNTPRITYPVGVTPFRYECLTPHVAAPPPGDPANPTFKPFDHREAIAYHESLMRLMSANARWQSLGAEQREERSVPRKDSLGDARARSAPMSRDHSFSHNHPVHRSAPYQQDRERKPFAGARGFTSRGSSPGAVRGLGITSGGGNWSYDVGGSRSLGHSPPPAFAQPHSNRHAGRLNLPPAPTVSTAIPAPTAAHVADYQSPSYDANRRGPDEHPSYASLHTLLAASEVTVRPSSSAPGSPRRFERRW